MPRLSSDDTRKCAASLSRAERSENQEGSPLVTGRPRAAREETLRRLPQEGGFEQAPALPARLADPELARGHVDEGGPQGAPRARSGAMQGEEKVVRGPVQVLRVGERPGGDDAHHLSPHELLALARRLHLLAHRHLASGADQPGDIAVGRVMGNARHGDGPLPLLARGEGDLEQARALVGVLEEELVKVAEAEEEEVVGVTLLELPVLQHHWGQRGGQRGRQRRRQPGRHGGR